MTIDGVANIDTGDNGGNMATTNIDAVAEFKILTNAYQAEYGRAVGGQVQVVTKSGTQAFHGSGYWYGRRSDWNANTWTEQARSHRRQIGARAETSRNDYGYTIGGPVFIPGTFNTDKKKLFFFWSQEFQRRTDPATERQSRGAHRARAARRLLAERRQQRQPVPLHPRLHDRACPAAPPTRAAASRTAACSAGFPQSRLYQPGLERAEHLSRRRTSRAAAASTSRARTPNSAPRREDLLRLDFQATDNWRVTGRYMKNKEDILQAYGTTWAGNGSDQLPTPVRSSCTPGTNYMLSATGILNPTRRRSS